MPTMDHWINFNSNSDKNIAKRGAVNALAAFAYIGLVALFLSLVQKFAGSTDRGVLEPVGFLSLLVLSATVMGTLIFAAPVMLYIDGKKSEAVRLLAWTIGSFTIITLCTFLVIVLTGMR